MVSFEASSLLNGSKPTRVTVDVLQGTSYLNQQRPIERGPQEEKIGKGETFMFGESLLRNSAPRRGTRRAATSVALLATAVVVGACGSGTTGTGSGGTPQPDPSTGNPGYFVKPPPPPGPL